MAERRTAAEIMTLVEKYGRECAELGVGSIAYDPGGPYHQKEAMKIKSEIDSALEACEAELAWARNDGKKLQADLAERRKQAREAVEKELAAFREQCMKYTPFVAPCANRILAICFGEETAKEGET